MTPTFPGWFAVHPRVLCTRVAKREWWQNRRLNISHHHLRLVLDHLHRVLQNLPETADAFEHFVGVWVVAHGLDELAMEVVVDVGYHDATPHFLPRRVAPATMSRKAGISFDEHTFERLQRVAGEDHLSPIVDRYCWMGLEADAELGKRGIMIDDETERMEFLLDRLEEGLDAWNA